MSTITNGTLSAPAEVIAASLARNLRREAISVPTVAAPVIQSGTPGLLSGQLTLLTTTLAAALALDAIYSGTATATLSGSNNTEQRRNYATVPNPTSLTGWQPNNGALHPATYDASGGRRAGTGAKRFTRAASSPSTLIASAYCAGGASWTATERVQVAPGERWTVSSYSKASVAFTASIAVGFYDAANNQIGLLADGASDPVAGAAGAWVRSSVTVTVPAGATNMGIARQEVNMASGTTSGGELAWMTDALIERGKSLDDYFDGIYSPDPDLAASWVGTANQSQSVLRSTDLPTGLHGLKHVAVGSTRMSAERALPGRRAKWLVTVDVVEVP
jgi:hypothetical protein